MKNRWDKSIATDKVVSRFFLRAGGKINIVILVNIDFYIVNGVYDWLWTENGWMDWDLQRQRAQPSSEKEDE